MKNKKIITNLVLIIVIISALVALNGIFSSGGAGEYVYESIRGNEVRIYGKGLYQHMSADVAIQGIAQDWVTLLFGIPALLASLYSARKNSKRGIFVLSGVLGYFLVTYLFYMAMAEYNRMFLAYVILLGASFFAFILNLFSYDMANLRGLFQSEKILKYTGIFLMINSILIALLWLSVIIPPLLDGTIIPKEVEHYTTLIVQGFDLGLLLPITFVSGFLALRKNSYGYLFTIINVIFLSLLMTALSSKILFMANAGQNVFPAVLIIPTIGLIAIGFSISIVKNIK